MGQTKPSREMAFRAALALRGLTQKAWAKEEGLSETHVVLVVGGKRESARLISKIDAFIDEVLPDIEVGAA